MQTYHEISYILGIPASIFCGIMLVAIGLSVTRPENGQLVRRHSARDRYWSVLPEICERSEGVLHPSQPRHLDATDDTTDVVGPEMEHWPTVGRRAIDSPVRHMPVPQDWRPYVGDLRIALLETCTAQYLFVRQPKDQLDTTRTQFVRAYAYTG